jgi:hypothetical protein
VVPGALKYLSTAGDVVLLTVLIWLAGGPSEPLVVAYFVIIALAAVRFSLGLVWFSTLASMLGYWSLVGLADRKWFAADHVVPVVTQLVMLLCLALTGITIGQVVRGVKRIATEYAERLAAAEGRSS